MASPRHIPGPDLSLARRVADCLHGFASPDQLDDPRADVTLVTRNQDAQVPACGWPEPAPYRRHHAVVVTLTPSLTAARFVAETTPAPAAVILRAYGPGDGPSDKPGLEQAVRELTVAGIPVVVTSQCLSTRIEPARAEHEHRGFFPWSGCACLVETVC
jgi:hypothetical protein